MMHQPSPEYQSLKVELRDGVLTVTMDRPETLNAMTPTMVDELDDIFARAHSMPDVRVVVLTGAGRAFSAGGDIEEDALPVTRMSAWEYRDNAKRFAAPILSIMRLDRPVIAAINGPAVGGGWDLALACDIRIASERVSFRDAYIPLGLIPLVGGTFLLPSTIGMGAAKRIYLCGDKVTAEEALQLGLVEKVVPHDSLADEVNAIARRVCARPSHAVNMTKILINEAFNGSIEAALRDVKNVAPILTQSAEYADAVNTFIAAKAERARDLENRSDGLDGVASSAQVVESNG